MDKFRIPYSAFRIPNSLFAAANKGLHPNVQTELVNGVIRVLKLQVVIPEVSFQGYVVVEEKSTPAPKPKVKYGSASKSPRFSLPKPRRP